MAISKQDFDYVRSIVRKCSALVLNPGKEYLVESRLHILARREGVSSTEDLLKQLRADPYGSLHRKVNEVMITGESTFFRDVRPFETLKRVILPDLLARRASERSLNIWCAASSGGQEPYSVAMLLRECAQSLAGWNIRFIASDFSIELLTKARQGRYTQMEINRGLPASLLVKYFRQSGSDWQIAAEIQNMVEFQDINLVKSWPRLPCMDVVFMRNVLIYFDLETRRMVLSRVRHLLKPDGYLFLGSSETILGLEDAFEPVTSDSHTCFRLRATALQDK
jgi:chemotaxis protein methyltransferase CheR